MSEPVREREELSVLLADARPRLVRALLAVRGQAGAEDAASEAIAWAWENSERMGELTNPVGYLYRVAMTRSTPRMRPELPMPTASSMPDIEPALVPALMQLPEKQRAAVWLVHACGWTYAEVADGLDIGTSTVGTHVTRALQSLRLAIIGDTGADT